MKANLINLTKQGFNFSANTYAPKSHYKMSMRLGHVFPTTKAQAHFFVVESLQMDVLNMDDVEVIENLLNKHGFEGDYKLTKSESWVRLQNNLDLISALKKEYSL